MFATRTTEGIMVSEHGNDQASAIDAQASSALAALPIGAGEDASAIAIGAPIPARAFREVLAQVMTGRGFQPVAASAAEEPAGALALRVAAARDRAGWLLIESDALRGHAQAIAAEIAAKLGAPATVCVARGAKAHDSVLLQLTTVDADGTVSVAERSAERGEDQQDSGLELQQQVEHDARHAVTDGDGSSAGERVLYRASAKSGTGNRRLDDILRAIEAGASYSFEDRADGRVMVRIDRGGTAGRQMSMLTRDEAHALKAALPAN
jgi:hypothetical protein